MDQNHAPEIAWAILFFQKRRHLNWMDLMVISSTGMTLTLGDDLGRNFL